MDCEAARALIDQGIEPGRQPDQARLGFHVAGCAACRWYHERQRSARSAIGGGLRPRPWSRAPRTQRAARHRLRWPDPALWRLGGAAIGSCALLVLALLGSIALRAYQNVDAMIIRHAEAHADIAPVPFAPAVVASEELPDERRREPRGAALSAAPFRAGPEAQAKPRDPLTILVLGVDARPGDTQPPHTDAILVVRLDPTKGRAALLSLPRDLWVAIPGQGHGRINSAYASGERLRPGNGPALASATVSKLLNMPIDAYVLVDFQGFTSLVDALGGITLTVERELYDGHYPTQNNGEQEVYFAPGRTAMDGATALIYSRIRHSDSDFQRIKRQQQVLTAICERLNERGVLRNLAEADALTAALRGYVQTDIPEAQMLSLIWAMRSLDPAQVQRLVVSPSMISLGVGNDLYAEVPDLQALRSLAAQLAP